MARTKSAPTSKALLKEAAQAKKPAPKKAPKKAVPAKKQAAPARKAAPTRSAEKAAPALKSPAKLPAKAAGAADVKALIEIATEHLPKDQVRAMIAGLDLVALANDGALSPELALKAWRAGTCLCRPSSQKAAKAQGKVLAERGIASPDAVIVDAGRRWLAARNDRDSETSSVAWLVINSLVTSGQYDEGISEFKKWTPVVMKLGKAGALDEKGDWLDYWYGTYLWRLDEQRGDEHARASAELAKAKR